MAKLWLAGPGAPFLAQFHSLRHFAASTLLTEGAPLTAVAGHLGDTVETVSRVYAHGCATTATFPRRYSIGCSLRVPSRRVSPACHGRESLSLEWPEIPSWWLVWWRVGLYAGEPTGV